MAEVIISTSLSTIVDRHYDPSVRHVCRSSNYTGMPSCSFRFSELIIFHLFHSSHRGLIADAKNAGIGVGASEHHHRFARADSDYFHYRTSR